MLRNRENRAVMAVLAATAGAGFSSGREVVLFFSQMEWTSWIGVVLASAMFGLLCGVVCRFARSTGAERYPDIYLRVLGSRQGSVVSFMHGLLMAMTASVMLVATGELAALALPVRNAFWMGLLLSLAAAFVLNLRRMRGLPAAGMAAAAACCLLYVSLALDPREPWFYRNYRTVPELSGSVTAAMLLAGLHASLNASVAGGITVRFARDVEKPARFAAKCAAGMLALLCAANAAILSGGERLFSLALPTVVLAARWGKTGYYLCIAVMWLCSVTTLAAALGTLLDHAETARARGQLLALFAVAGVAALLLGYERLIETGYPILGWIGAFSLFGLACCCSWERSGKLKEHNHDKITC